MLGQSALDGTTHHRQGHRCPGDTPEHQSMSQQSEPLDSQQPSGHCAERRQRLCELRHRSMPDGGQQQQTPAHRRQEGANCQQQDPGTPVTNLFCCQQNFLLGRF